MKGASRAPGEAFPVSGQRKSQNRKRATAGILEPSRPCDRLAQSATFEVEGAPATKGSWRVIRGNLVPDNQRERPWAEEVAWRAKAAGVRVVGGPVRVAMAFRFSRPKKPAHEFPSRNDVDKLARSVLDALTGIAWVDDQQVVSLEVTKRYGEAGATISIRSAA